MLQVSDPRRSLSLVENAGSVFMGSWSPEQIGDYCSGPKPVQPTHGHARTASGLPGSDFVKPTSVQDLSPEGLRALAPTAIALARLEGLDAHANAVSRRLEVLDAASVD